MQKRKSKETTIRISADVLAETLQARRDQQDIAKVMAEKNPTAKESLSGKAIIHI